MGTTIGVGPCKIKFHKVTIKNCIFACLNYLVQESSGVSLPEVSDQDSEQILIQDMVQ